MHNALADSTKAIELDPALAVAPPALPCPWFRPLRRQLHYRFRKALANPT